MKRVSCLLLAAVMVVALLMTGCATGIAEEDYNRVVEERDQARAEVASLENELDQAKDDVLSVSMELTAALLDVTTLEERVAALEAGVPIVEEPLPEGALPPIQFTFINAEMGGILLKGDDLAPYGYPGEINVAAPWTITIEKGSTITVLIDVSGHPDSGSHHIIIEGTDVDARLGVGGILGTEDLTFNEVGTFKVYSETLPAELECFIEVTEAAPVGEEPAPKMAKYKCTVCPYVYDPELGDPDGGIEPGTPFEEIPDDWVCPVCKKDKSYFEVVEEAAPAGEEPTPEVAALPPIQFTFINAEMGGILLKGDDLAPYGYPGEINVAAPWTITIPKGSTITVLIDVSGHPDSGSHHIIIEGTDVDARLGVGGILGTEDLTFNEVGTFKVYSETLPAELECFIEVTE